MNLCHFRLNGEQVFTEEQFDYPQNLTFLCECCGADFACAVFSRDRKWRFITSHCAECDPKWGGSFFDLPDRALWNALPRRILDIELEQEVKRSNINTCTTAVNLPIFPKD